MTSVRGPSAGSYMSDWSWKPSRRDRMALAVGNIKEIFEPTPKDIAKFLKSLPPDERQAILKEYVL